MKSKLTQKRILELLHNIVFTSMGVTDPIGIALAAATAYREIKGEVQSVCIALDKNIYKNAMAVGIPGTDKKGPKMAIALGIVCGDPDKGLLLLEGVENQHIKIAEKLLTKNNIRLQLNDKVDHIYIQAEIVTTNGIATVLIEGWPDHIVSITKNKQTIFEEKKKLRAEKSDDVFARYDFTGIRIEDIINMINKIPDDKLAFLNKGVTVNLEAAEKGLSLAPGMKLGATLQKMIKKGIVPNSFANRAKMLVAAATDARTGGVKVPIFSCVGSGNHGITFFITVGLSYQKLPTLKEISLQKVLAFGLLLLVVVKKYTGILTPMCGCAVAVSAAASAAITYSLGGTPSQILAAFNLVLGDVTGMVCDGAKYGCALKLSTAASVAIESALLAMQNIYVPPSDGVVGNTLLETLENIRILHKRGMKAVDRTMLDILLKKEG